MREESLGTRLDDQGVWSNLNLHPGCTVWVLLASFLGPAQLSVTCSTEEQRKAERGLGTRLADIGNANHTRTKQKQAFQMFGIARFQVRLSGMF